MALKITFELSDTDLEHFAEIFKRARERAKAADVQSILQAAKALLQQIGDRQVADFIGERINKLRVLIGMVEDETWAIPDEERERVVTALAYFGEPEDIIPDSIPGVGYLDDAIMVELAQRELKHEIDAYEDFVKYRDAEAARRGVSVEDFGRSEFMQTKRQALHSRMRRRRRGEASRRSTRGDRRRGTLFSWW